MNRRSFLMTSAAAPGAALASNRRPQSANETVRVAVLGVNGRGRSHIGGLQPLPNVEVVTLVDPDLNVANERAAAFEKQYGRRPAVVQDMRRVFDDKEIDVVTIATPNHWHALATIWACQAGKDVYVEKPGTHSVAEGRSMIAAAKKYNRIVQHGVQLRSSEAIQEPIQKVKDGFIGDVYMARATIFKWRPKMEHHANEAPPSHLDYEMWVGPGKLRPYSKNHVHYNWHWTWDFGNGEIGNQGVHEIDLLQWGLGVKLPTKVTALGGKYLWKDHRETPEVMSALCEFGKGRSTPRSRCASGCRTTRRWARTATSSTAARATCRLAATRPTSSSWAARASRVRRARRRRSTTRTSSPPSAAGGPRTRTARSKPRTIPRRWPMWPTLRSGAVRF
jgi:predicted dehydrogenase